MQRLALLGHVESVCADFLPVALGELPHVRVLAVEVLLTSVHPRTQIRQRLRSISTSKASVTQPESKRGNAGHPIPLSHMQSAATVTELI